MNDNIRKLHDDVASDLNGLMELSKVDILNRLSNILDAKSEIIHRGYLPNETISRLKKLFNDVD